MNRTRIAMLGALLLTGLVVAAEQPATQKIDDKLLALHRDEAKRWEIFVDEERTKQADFVSEPVYRWTNAAREIGRAHV